jgi:UDP-N-acetylglucosamine diphosphorylase/glucosamine-1-phosphate N-acetyltransferase
MTKSNFILFDSEKVGNLLPLAYTRAVADFRVGIFTIKEKWQLHLKQAFQVLTRTYLQDKYSINWTSGSNLYINSGVLPNDEVLQAIQQLLPNQALKSQNEIIAFHSEVQFQNLHELYSSINSANVVEFLHSISVINYNWDVFKLNGAQIHSDIKFITATPSSTQLKNALAIKNPEQIFVEEGAVLESCILNATDGPIYIGKHATILDGAIVKGPAVIGEHAVVKMGAKIYGETTIGPYCKVGGEISNTVLFAYSNKGHDGYLGNSVIGEWCNLGADTNTSNLKNNYSLVQSWNYPAEDYINTQLQFCGLVMGDHSKCGINTMFNTATVVGVAANIYGSDFPPKFIPSFSWGSHSGWTTFKLDKVFEMADNMMGRRDLKLTLVERVILSYVLNQDQKFRQQLDQI